MEALEEALLHVFNGLHNQEANLEARELFHECARQTILIGSNSRLCIQCLVLVWKMRRPLHAKLHLKDVFYSLSHNPQITAQKFKEQHHL